MKLKVSVEYSDKTSCFELKLFQNEPKKLSLGDATVKQKNWRLHMHQESLQLSLMHFISVQKACLEDVKGVRLLKNFKQNFRPYIFSSSDHPSSGYPNFEAIEGPSTKTAQLSIWLIMLVLECVTAQKVFILFDQLWKSQLFVYKVGITNNG